MGKQIFRTVAREPCAMIDAPHGYQVFGKKAADQLDMWLALSATVFDRPNDPPRAYVQHAVDIQPSSAICHNQDNRLTCNVHVEPHLSLSCLNSDQQDVDNSTRYSTVCRCNAGLEHRCGTYRTASELQEQRFRSPDHDSDRLILNPITVKLKTDWSSCSISRLAAWPSRCSNHRPRMSSTKFLSLSTMAPLVLLQPGQTRMPIQLRVPSPTNGTGLIQVMMYASICMSIVRHLMHA